MIITKNMVYIHMPKTGGTFVTEMIKNIHDSRRNRWQHRLKRFLKLDSEGILDFKKHHGVKEIPEKYQHLPILGTIRNPYDRFVSQYEFQKAKDMEITHWKGSEKLRQKFLENPHWPFEEYVHWRNQYSPPFFKTTYATTSVVIGLHTRQFISTYAHDPENLFERIQMGNENDITLESDFSHIGFLRTDSLNKDLVDKLAQVGYTQDEITFILKRPKIRPPRSRREDSHKWEFYFTFELKKYVRECERIIFRIFPEFDV